MSEDTKKLVRESYGEIAQTGSSCCGPKSSCSSDDNQAVEIGKHIGYSSEEMSSVPEGANLGLGCGNPTAVASLQEGETVLDLGSGAGFDCFLAAQQVGKSGKVIGVDMTSDMLDKARENANKGNFQNVEFRLGEIEHLPIADNSVDVIISNCVINLSPDKPAVFGEAFRVLKPGGRLMVSDIVLLQELPERLKSSAAAYVGCIAGAELKDNYLASIRTAGFEDVSVLEESYAMPETVLKDPVIESVVSDLSMSSDELRETAGNYVKSIRVQGMKTGALSELTWLFCCPIQEKIKHVKIVKFQRLTIG